LVDRLWAAWATAEFIPEKLTRERIPIQPEIAGVGGRRERKSRKRKRRIFDCGFGT